MTRHDVCGWFVALVGMVFAGCSSGTPQTKEDVTEDKGEAVEETSEVVIHVDVQEAEAIDEVGGEEVEELYVPACEPGAGCFGDPCTQNEQCLSGWCMEHMGEGTCSNLCEEECPAGWACAKVAGTDPDVVYVCVSKFANLCKPCATSGDCKSPGGADDVCVDYGEQGAFCGGPCGGEQACPPGFSCLDVKTVDGADTKQCVSNEGVCECTSKSIALSLSTPCTTSNDLGACEGKRVCMPGGLSDCSAAVPAVEECDGEDDDCNGMTDEGTCDDGNDCTLDDCAGEQGCTHEKVNGGECMDGNPCTLADHCDNGECVGSAVECSDDDVCTDDLCDADGGCVFVPNAAACDDGNPCTVADECAEGTCSGFPIDCECLVDADCVGLEDGNLCNGTLRCDAAKLPHLCAVDAATVVACDSSQDTECLKAACDPAGGACAPAPVGGTPACEDGDPCTFGDKCVGGVCQPGANLMTELCNGLDDDCDGEVDEGFDLGAPCQGGVGACVADGTTVCAPGGFVTMCGAVPGPPQAETCNAVDDDCDGEVDEVGKSDCLLENAYGVCAGEALCLPGGSEVCVGTYAAFEACNGVDDDCDGETDENFDVDGACIIGKGACAVQGKKKCSDDGNGTICEGEPGLPVDESCNGQDDDCNGTVDEPGAAGCTDYYADADKDGFGKGAETICMCQPTYPYSALVGGDCAEDNAKINPGAAEVCNGLDDDCSGNADDPGSKGCATYYADLDGDGFGDAGSSSCLCGPGGGFDTVLGTDCDDADAGVHPGVAEVCNGKDDDCDGDADEGYDVAAACTEGKGICQNAGKMECTADGKGTKCSATAGVPGVEACNGKDDDCDGDIDEGFPGVGGVCTAGVGKCTAAGVQVCSADGKGLECAAPVVVPGVEACGDGDEDCDGKTDEEEALGCSVFYLDNDGDGHGVAASTKCLCLPVFPYAATKVGDCDDKNAAAYPGATEKCGGGDEDCDGSVDEEGAANCQSYYPDADGDKYGPDNDKKCLCAALAPYLVKQGGDCDDTKPAVNPGVKEACGGGDENCNGKVDEADAIGCVTAYQDEDGDGHGTQAKVCTCAVGQGYVGWVKDDCNDADPGVFAGATELCNGKDDDCDGKVDDGFDLNSDPENCGACGVKCPTPGVSGLNETCVAKQCVVGKCPDGWYDVDKNPANGCEKQGKILYVDDDNNTGIEDGSLAHPFRTVNLALYFAEPGTIVHMLNGTYNEKVVVETENLTIRGESKAGVLLKQSDPMFPTVESKANRFALRSLTVQGQNFGVKLSTTDLCVIDSVEIKGAQTPAPKEVNAIGLWVFNSTHAVVTSVHITGFRGGESALGMGIRLEKSNFNTFDACAIDTIHGPDPGNLSASAAAFWMESDSWSNYVKTNTTAEGSPVVYLFRQHGATVQGQTLGGPLAPTNLGRLVALESDNLSLLNNKVSGHTGISYKTGGKSGSPGWGIRAVNCQGIKIKGNTVSSVHGGGGGVSLTDTWNAGGNGSIAYGVLIEGCPAAVLASNSISDLYGGEGGDSVATLGPGGTGGAAIAVSLSSSPLAQVEGNTAKNLVGGNGGDGVGTVGYGGAGGSAWGIEVKNSPTTTTTGGTISQLKGGATGSGWGASYTGNGGACRGLQFTGSAGATVKQVAVSQLTGGNGNGNAFVIGVALGTSAGYVLEGNQVTALTGGAAGGSYATGFDIRESAGGTVKKNTGDTFAANASSERYFLYFDKPSENANVSMDNLADGDPVVFLYNAQNITIGGLTLDSPLQPSNYGKVTVLSSSGVTFQDLAIRNFGMVGQMAAGIRLSSCTACTVKRVVMDGIQGAPSVGIYAEASTNLAVNNVSLYGVGKAGEVTAKGVHVLSNSAGAVNSTVFHTVNGHCIYNEAAAASLQVRYSLLFGCTQSSVYNNNADTYKLLYLDPLYVNPGAGDLHLQATSPCINAGDPAFDWCKEPNPNGCRIDMGGYGGSSAATPKPGASHCPCP